MNYLVKGIASFLGHSIVFRFISLLWRQQQIDLISALTSGILLAVLSTSFFYLWHQNPSMEENIINFIAFASLTGVLAGILV
jgi:uncharacterized membrane protein YhhN